MHRIRLRKPWTRTASTDSNHSFVAFLRKFNRPTGLTGDQIVRLALTRSDATNASDALSLSNLQVVLNGREVTRDLGSKLGVNSENQSEGEDFENNWLSQPLGSCLENANALEIQIAVGNERDLEQVSSLEDWLDVSLLLFEEAA